MVGILDGSGVQLKAIDERGMEGGQDGHLDEILKILMKGWMKIFEMDINFLIYL